MHESNTKRAGRAVHIMLSVYTYLSIYLTVCSICLSISILFYLLTLIFIKTIVQPFQTGVYRKANPILYTEIVVFTFKFEIKWLFNLKGLLSFTREENFKTWLEIFFWFSLLLSYFQSAFSIPPFGFKLLLNCIKF